MPYKYSRYISRLAKHPWAITVEKFAVIAELMRERAAGHKPTDEEIVARLSGDDGELVQRDQTLPTDGKVAVIPVHGTIAHRADSFEASSGGTSTERIGKLLQVVVANASVKAIVLDFDTPGGSVEGVPELGAQIGKAAKVKPVIAMVNALAASAGYWLASQCSEIVVTPSGLVGSIGVFLLLVDESEALANAGIVINAISAGANKLEGAPWQPLSDESRAHFQGQVDAVYADFKAAVAKGRGVTAAQVEKSYGQGRCFDAATALELGMVDRIATMDATLAKLLGSGQPRTTGMAAEIVATAPAEPVVDAMPPAVTATVPAADRDALDLALAQSDQG